MPQSYAHCGCRICRGNRPFCSSLDWRRKETCYAGLEHGIAPAHTERLPGDVAGAIGGQKGDDLGDICGEAKATQGIAER